MIQAVEKPNWKCKDYLSIKTDEHSICPVHIHTQEKSRLTSADKPRQRERGKDRCRRADGERPPASRRLRYRWKCGNISVPRTVWPHGKRALVADLKATLLRTWSQPLLPINSVASAGHGPSLDFCDPCVRVNDTWVCLNQMNSKSLSGLGSMFLFIISIYWMTQY